MKLKIYCSPIAEKSAALITTLENNQIQEKHEFNLNSFPWKFKDNCFEEIEIEHVLETTDSIKLFMEEIYRIAKMNSKIEIKAYYFNSIKQHTIVNQKRQISEYTFLPFNRNWRIENKIEEIINCNFEFVYGYDVGQEWSFRSEESRNFAIKHYCNVVDKLIVTLNKKP